MNHFFFPKQDTPKECKTCSLPMLAHLKTAECKVCGKMDASPTGNYLELEQTVLMCRSCRTHNQKLTQENNKPEEQEKRIAQSNAQTQEAINQHIESYTGFFNARITPIVQVKELYDLDSKSLADYHESIKSQIEHFQRVLFEHQDLKLEEDTTSRLLIELRVEVRTKLKEGDINYTPPIKAPKVRTDRVSGGKAKTPLEKMAELLVGQAASQGKIMTIAEATRKLQREMGLTK